MKDPFCKRSEGIVLHSRESRTGLRFESGRNVMEKARLKPDMPKCLKALDSKASLCMIPKCCGTYA